MAAGGVVAFPLSKSLFGSSLKQFLIGNGKEQVFTGPIGVFVKRIPNGDLVRRIIKPSVLKGRIH